MAFAQNGNGEIGEALAFFITKKVFNTYLLIDSFVTVVDATSVVESEGLHTFHQLGQLVIKLISLVSGSLEYLREETSFFSHHDSEARLCHPRFKPIEEIQLLLVPSSFLIALFVYHLGYHLVKTNIMGLLGKVIYQHVVVSSEQGSATHMIDEISEYTVSDGVTIEG